jgi:hypothetical protein
MVNTDHTAASEKDMIKASGLAYDQTTRDWTKLVVVELRDRMEAIRWMNFNRDWMKDLKIIETPNINK